MKKITSFTVDHLRLLAGLYVSRVDWVGEEAITTFDLRFTRPNVEQVMDVPALHSIEHLGATLARSDKEWGSRVLYFGPMGCRTGFYLLVAGQVTPEEILPLVKRIMTGILDYQGTVPGAAPAECGNYLSHNLAMAKYEAGRYLNVLKAIEAGESDRTVYPEGGIPAAIGFVAAMESELDEIKAVLPELETVVQGGRTFYVGPNVYAVLSGIGELAAASATEALIWFARSQGVEIARIINAGVCGSLVPGKFAIGEPLLVEKLVHYEFDISAIEDLGVGQYPDEPSALLELNMEGLPAMTRVTLASGDKFCSDPALVSSLVDGFGADICEMEGAGIVRTASVHGIPATLIKTISDEAGTEDQAESYWESGRAEGMSTLQGALKQVLAALGES
ncbi:MAG: S-ribosylhomocysteine lyase [Propionibacteriaceae bacterium]|jgi:S-ribosylhomocysteine lyase|nr:S-ribosylhomocysteine lyase [Propionibacteriaceae bacterium]